MHRQRCHALLPRLPALQRRASLAERTAAAAATGGGASSEGSASVAAAVAAATADVAPRDLLDMLLMATDENGVPMTGECMGEMLATFLTR